MQKNLKTLLKFLVPAALFIYPIIRLLSFQATAFTLKPPSLTTIDMLSQQLLHRSTSIHEILDAPVPAASTTVPKLGKSLSKAYQWLARLSVWNSVNNRFKHVLITLRDASLPRISEWIDYLKNLDLGKTSH